MIFREVNVGFVVFNLMLDIVIPTSLAEGSVLQSVSMGLSSRPPVSGSPNLLSRSSHLDSFFYVDVRKDLCWRLPVLLSLGRSWMSCS